MKAAEDEIPSFRGIILFVSCYEKVSSLSSFAQRLKALPRVCGLRLVIAAAEQHKSKVIRDVQDLAGNVDLQILFERKRLFVTELNACGQWNGIDLRTALWNSGTDRIGLDSDWTGASSILQPQLQPQLSLQWQLEVQMQLQLWNGLEQIFRNAQSFGFVGLDHSVV